MSTTSAWWSRPSLPRLAKPAPDEKGGGVVFSERQQEMFGVDQDGAIIDHAQFEVAMHFYDKTLAPTVPPVAVVSAPPPYSEPAPAMLDVERPTTTKAATPKPESPTQAHRDCFVKDATYLPLDMVGEMMTYEADRFACQTRCAMKEGCKHFSYGETDKSCHITDAAFLQMGSVGTVAGPSSCGRSYSQEVAQEEDWSVVQEYEAGETPGAARTSQRVAWTAPLVFMAAVGAMTAGLRRYHGSLPLLHAYSVVRAPHGDGLASVEPLVQEV